MGGTLVVFGVNATGLKNATDAFHGWLLIPQKFPSCLSVNFHALVHFLSVVYCGGLNDSSSFQLAHPIGKIAKSGLCDIINRTTSSPSRWINVSFVKGPYLHWKIWGLLPGHFQESFGQGIIHDCLVPQGMLFGSFLSPNLFYFGVLVGLVVWYRKYTVRVPEQQLNKIGFHSS